jgi:hypothetical protein
MNYTSLNADNRQQTPTHKPIISLFKSGIFQCSDGCLVQYGYTREEAALNYWLAL